MREQYKQLRINEEENNTTEMREKNQQRTEIECSINEQRCH